MNFYVDSGGTVIAVDPEKVYQGQAYANRIRLIGPFASTLAVTVGFTLPNGERITPQLMTNVNGNLHEPFEDFSIWEYVIPKTITNYAGVVKVQFYVHGTRTVLVRNVETEKYEEKPQSTVIATGGSSFNVEKGVPIYPLDGEEAVDYEMLLTDILGALSSLQERCKINLENGTGENSVQQKGTTAGYANQMTVGENNANKNNTLFEVGNGESEEERSNAFEVLRDGRAKVQSEPTEETDVVRLKDVSNYVTTNTHQTISAGKSFEYDDGKNRRAVDILSAGIVAEVRPTGSFVSSNSTTFNAYGIDVQEAACTAHYGSTSISYVCDGNDGELQLPISQSGSYILATTDDVAMVETKIKFHEKVLFQSGIVGVLEKSQAYTARETAEGANIVDGQTTPVLEIAGDTVKTTNLIPFPYIGCGGVQEKTANGVTYTISEDGTITVNGTSTASVYINLQIRSNENTPLYDAGDYVLSGCHASGSINTYHIYAQIEGNDTAYRDYGNGVTFNLTERKRIGIVVVLNSGVTFTNAIFKPMLKSGTVAGEFVPYFAGLKNAFINSIKSTGRNVFNVNTDFIKAIEEKWYTTYPVKVENGIFYSSGKRGVAVGSCICCELVENKDYVLSFIANFDEATEYPATVELNFFNDWTGNKFNSLKNIRKVVVNGGNTITFNSSDFRYVAVGAFSVTLHGTALSNIQIEYGKVATDFKPYTENTFQLPQTLELGKWDKFNPQTGELTRVSKRIVFDGTEAWTVQSINSNGLINLSYNTVNAGNGLGIGGACYCNLYSVDDSLIANSTRIAFLFQGRNFFVREDATVFPSADEWKAHLAELYAAGNPLTIEYEIATPTTETLTDIPKSYTAWKNGSETIIQGETDNSAYGAMPTITQTYLELLGVNNNE